MAYSSNPYIGKARRLAVNDVIYGRLTKAQAARRYGVHRSTIGKWITRADPDHRVFIQTRSSRPKQHPHELRPEVVARVIQLRKELRRCAPILYAHLKQEDIQVSLSSIKRIIKRNNLTRKKKPATWYSPIPRPLSDAPGALVQIDTIHFVRPDKSRFYVYALIDVYSRMAYAEYHQILSQKTSLAVILHAQKEFGFTFKTVQADNGPEFRDWLQAVLSRQHIHLRHSRVRKPNDNAHIERFNRTIQDECFRGLQPNEKTIRKQVKAYLTFYNTRRLHLSLNCLTPAQFVAKLLN